jgi:hypothetical protein
MTGIHRFLLGLTLATVIALAAVQFAFVSSSNCGDQRFPMGRVRGVSVLYNEKLHTLNFSQQRVLITALNGAEEGKFFKTVETSPFSAVVIHSFGEEDASLFPVGSDRQGCLVFNVGGLQLREKTDGELKKLLEGSYDTEKVDR